MKIPYPFQTVAKEKGLRNHLLLADACGLGKTVSALEIAKGLRDERGWGGPVLVVTTKKTKLQWQEVIEEQDPGAWVYQPEDVDSFFFAEIDSASECYVVLHHEQFLKLTKKSPILKIFWMCMIIDEAHKIKGRKAKRTKAIKKVQARRKVALTATPMERLPSDLWSILNWMYPEHYRGFHGFYAKYVKEVEGYMGHMQPVGGKNLDNLALEIRPIFLKRTKKEVAPDLPPLTQSTITVEMELDQARLYKSLVEATKADILVDLSDHGLSPMLLKNALAEFAKLHQISTWPGQVQTTTKPYKSGKLQWLFEYIEANPDENIAIFSRYRLVTINLAHQYKAPCIVGGTDDQSWARGERLVFGTIGAMGTAIDMPWIDTSIFLDQSWSTIEMSQANDRIHRLGIDSPKQVIYLRSKGTVDGNVIRALRHKWTEIQLLEDFIKDVQNGGDEL